MSVRSIRKREVEASAEMEADGDELPKGWAFVRLDELTESPKLDIVSGPFGSNLKSSEYVDKGVPLIRLQNIDRAVFLEKNIRFITREKAGELSSHSFVSGDVVISKLGDPVGKACIVPLSLSAGVIVADVVRARIDEKRALSNYVVLAINSPAVISQVNLEVKGSTRPRVNLSNIREMRIPLAPLAEQRRIVGKLELLLGKVSSSQQRLSRVPGLLKRFRQSVLAAACSGKLTADWREENGDVEPSRMLLDRIDQERTTKTTSDSVVRLADEDSPTDIIPDTWSWVRFGSVIGELRNGVSIRPNVDPPGTPILRISAARPGFVDLSDFRFMPESDRFIPLSTLRDGDLLFTRYNGSLELLGVCGMVRGLGRDTVLYPDKLMRVRFDHDLISPSYAELFFQVGEVHERIIAKSKSSAGQNGVSGSDIKNQSFAVPPLSEQQEIVRRVEKLFAFADQIEARLRIAVQHVDRLTQSLLAKAFRGELVPTEHALATAAGRDYEPASELLKRIRTTNANASSPKTKRGKASKT